LPQTSALGGPKYSLIYFKTLKAVNMNVTITFNCIVHLLFMFFVDIRLLFRR
jgi:hypothetical protein